MRIVVGPLPLKQVPVVGCFVKAIQTVVGERQNSETGVAISIVRRSYVVFLELVMPR